MGKIDGFLEIERQSHRTKKAEARVKNFKEFTIALTEPQLKAQGARCMDCGIPYCHQGCPINNLIPNWNDLVYQDDWQNALIALHKTNNFPEFTGRICPAPCEAACTLNLIEEPVSIKDIECAIVDKGWRNNWIKPIVAPFKSGKSVAVVGSGPAGLAAAQQLARMGHSVVVFEKNPKIGGLLRYGIPDFKMEKTLIDRRIKQMEQEGVKFKPNTNVGVELATKKLLAGFDAVVLATGAEVPRPLEVEASHSDGICFAMEFLTRQNKLTGRENAPATPDAKNKRVVVIGGGDTGSDCIGTANRQGAKSVTQLEILDKPPLKEDKLLTWPDWPLKLRTSSSQQEGCQRSWAVATKRFLAKDGKVTGLELQRVKWENGRMRPVKGKPITLKADLVLLAMGFVHPTHDGLVKSLKLKLDARGNVAANEQDYRTSTPKVFACGDMRRGQSLVVWAIREGRAVAESVNGFLMGKTIGKTQVNAEVNA